MKIIEQILPFALFGLTCALWKNETGEIFGFGRCSDISMKDHPYQMTILTNSGTCGASIVSNKWVLTAAHCLEGVSKILLRSAGRMYSVSSILIHPSYNPSSRDYDFALINITSTFQNGSSIPLGKDDPKMGTRVAVIRWRTIVVRARKIPVSNIAQACFMTIQSCDHCDPFPITFDTRICATKADTSSCFIDDGTPVVVGHGQYKIQVGITSSWSTECLLDNCNIFISSSYAYDWVSYYINASSN